MGRGPALRSCSIFVLCAIASAGCDDCGGNGNDKDSGNVSADSGSVDAGGDRLALRVTSADARACEVVLQDAAGAVAAIRFDDSVEGRFLSERGRVAASFFSRSDQGMAAGAIAVELKVGATEQGVSVASSRCFDRTGATLAGATVEFGS